MENRKRYTQVEYERNTYYQLPQFLFDEEFISMSNDAKVLYTLLRARHDWSVANGKVNEKGEIYLVMTRGNMCAMLQVSENTITKMMTELKKYNLIEEERLGQGKPNRVYLLEIQNRKTYVSRTAKIEVQEPQKLRPIYNSINKTNSLYISEKGEKVPKEPEGSFDTDEFYNLAVKKTYSQVENQDKDGGKK